MMMKASAWIVLLGRLLLQATGVSAIYKDDIGVLDFSVATAGHGPVGWVSFTDDLILTTDRTDESTSCYVAARATETGALAWRRNVCSVPDEDSQSHSVAVDKDGTSFFTVDNMGLARGWTMDAADLLWEFKVESTAAPPSIFFADGYVGVGAGNQLVVLEASTGEAMDTISSSLGKEGQHVEWLSVLPVSSNTLSVSLALVDSSSGIISNGGDFYIGTYELKSGSFKPSAGKLKAKDIISSSVKVLGSDSVWAATTSGAVVHSSGASVSGYSGVEPTSDPSVVMLYGSKDGESEASMEAFTLAGSSLEKISTSDENSAIAVAPQLGVVVTTPTGQSVEVHDLKSGKALKITGDVFGSDGDSVSAVAVNEDSNGGATILIGTERGSTTVVSLSKNGADGSVSLSVDWTAEEGLANLSSAIILDASHLGADDLVEEQDSLAYKLSLTGRLNAQWKEITSMISTANGLIGGSAESGKTFNYRDHLFGFLKVSALLSSKNHKMWGMSTFGADRGSIRWSLDLPKTAMWHSMVHGTTNAANVAHGIHGDTHSREILVLSASPQKLDWMCIDGTSGAVNAQDSIPLASPIQQVVPIYGSSTGGCRQASLLLGEDLSLTVVPADAQTTSLVQNQLHKTPNGFYTHKIDKDANSVHSYRVVDTKTGGFSAVPVGMASFEGEQIVEVAYPMRHEDMQSMSTILGDNSLLLKYINPHMAVVVTMLSDEEDQAVTEVAKFIEKESPQSKKRKPTGVGAPGSSTTGQQPGQLPNMFINLVDTVSGRVLYRHSHSDVDPSKKVSVVVSENWVVYSYSNAKTRRTEIGVLTLHEGMIEPKGLTYFASPDQSETFSSFDSRESKPVVLSKVYAYPKAVTALGVTSTKQGISRQNILLASSDGSLSTINKMILETRRPVGEVKPEEKKEGLVPYKEMIPDSPLLSLNYNQTMEAFSSIVSTTTSLESQSMVFGFGGPDLFFTRTSPTKGFDLLPETFNKFLVGLTTVGIVVALFVVKQMGGKKSLKQSWS